MIVKCFVLFIYNYQQTLCADTLNDYLNGCIVSDRPVNCKHTNILVIIQ